MLRRRVKALRAQVAAYDACIQQISSHPVYGKQAHDALLAAYVPLPDEPGWEDRVWRVAT